MSTNYLKSTREIFDLKKGFSVITGLWGGKLCYRVMKDDSSDPVDIFPCVSFRMVVVGNLVIMKAKGWLE